MLRTQRVSAFLHRAFRVGAAAMVLSASSVIAGCQDESQPEYWIEKLDDNAMRPRAIKQLDQFYEDAVTRAGQSQDSPELKALVEKVVTPLSQTYVEHYDNLDEKARERLIKLLAAVRDPRTEPALTKALAEFAEKGRGGEDVKWAARAVADMKLTAAADEMIGAFVKLRASSEEGGPVWRDLNASMLKLADKSWVPTLIEKLSPALELPKSGGEENKPKVIEFQNQQFWQITSVQLLGAIGDPAGVEPLLRVVLDPGKAPLQQDAVISLVKLGKPSVARATQLLHGEDKELVEFAAQKARKAAGLPTTSDAPHVGAAAIVLGTVGHASAAAPLIDALSRSQTEANKAILLRELAKLPATPEVQKAFQEGFVALAPDAVIPPGDTAHHVLAESAASFLDAGMVPWMLQQTAAAKGEEGTQQALLQAAIKLMTPEHVASVGAAVDKYGTEVEKALFGEASALVKSCGKEVACYLDAATKSANQTQKTQFVGIKAAYMVGVFGNEKVRDELANAIDSISNAAVRFTAAKVIDRLSPKGSEPVADSLQKIVDANVKRGDAEKIAGDAPLKQVIYRLRSRAHS